MADPVADLDPVSAVATAVEQLLKASFSRAWTVEHVALPMTMKEFERVTRALPWIGIGWSQSDPVSEAGRVPIYRLDLQLIFLLRNPHPAGRFLGDGASPGLYPSLYAAARLLHGHAVADVGTITVGKVSQAYSDAYGDMDLCVGMIEFSARTAVQPARSIDDLPDFARLATSWDFGQGSNGPADSLTDIISVESTT